ncbi:hypothetical protein N499_0904 [Wolbachia pipientis wVitA]|nr:hypothetical protein N499_0904 [Wolbachia pipientis wVitA]RLT61901.1 hypothetical protein WANA34_0640 [Wolbachia endosymbiont of Drosophila ananassae]
MTSFAVQFTFKNECLYSCVSSTGICHANCNVRTVMRQA